MTFPRLDQPVIVLSLAFGPLGVIIVLVWLRSFRKKREEEVQETSITDIEKEGHNDR